MLLHLFGMLLRHDVTRGACFAVLRARSKVFFLEILRNIGCFQLVVLIIPLFLQRVYHRYAYVLRVEIPSETLGERQRNQENESCECGARGVPRGTGTFIMRVEITHGLTRAGYGLAR